MTFVHKSTFLRSAVLEDPLGWGEMLTPQDILAYEMKFPELFSEALATLGSEKSNIAEKPHNRFIHAQKRALNNLPIGLPRKGPNLNRLTELAKPARCSRDRCRPPEKKIQGKGDLKLRYQRPRSSPSKPLSGFPVITRSKSVSSFIAERKNFVKPGAAQTRTVFNTVPMRADGVLKLQESFSAEGMNDHDDSRKPKLLYRKSRSHPGRLAGRYAKKTYEVAQREMPRRVVSQPRSLSSSDAMRKRRDLLKQVDALKLKVQQSRLPMQGTFTAAGRKRGAGGDVKVNADTKAKLMNIFTDTLMRSFKSPKSITSDSTGRNTSVVRFSDESFLSSVGEPAKIGRAPLDVMGHLSDINEELDVSNTTVSSSISSNRRSEVSNYNDSNLQNLRYRSPVSRELDRSEEEKELTKASVSKCEQLLLTNILASQYAKEGKFQKKKTNLRVPLLVPSSQQLLGNLERQEEGKQTRGGVQGRMLEEIAHELIYAEVMKIIDEEKRYVKNQKAVKSVKRKSVATETSFAEKLPEARIEQEIPLKEFVSIGVETSFASKAVKDEPPDDMISTNSSSMSMSPFKTPTLTPPNPLPSFPKAKPEFLQLLMGGSGRFLRKTDSNVSSITNPKTPTKTGVMEQGHERSSNVNPENTDCSELEDFVASTAAEPNLKEAAAANQSLVTPPSQSKIQDLPKPVPAKAPELSGQFNESIPMSVLEKPSTHRTPEEFDLSELETSINSILGSIISEGELVLRNLQLETGNLKSPGEISSQWPYSPGLHLSAVMQDLDLSNSLFTPTSIMDGVG